MFSPLSMYSGANSLSSSFIAAILMLKHLCLLDEERSKLEGLYAAVTQLLCVTLLPRAQGKVLTVHRTPPADPFLMNLASHPLLLVQEKLGEEERGEKGTITRTKLQVKIRDKPLLGHADFQSNGRKNRKSSVSEGRPPPLPTSWTAVCQHLPFG